MVNPIRGEVSLPAGDETFTLRFSANALVDLEDALGMGIVAIGAEMTSWASQPARIRFKTIRAVVWAGLQEHHPERLEGGAANPDGVDLRRAGDIIVAAGGIEPVTSKISEAFARAFPAPETKGARPPKPEAATNGTGAASSPTGSRTASTRTRSGARPPAN
jgi:hypothetical protein